MGMGVASAIVNDDVATLDSSSVDPSPDVREVITEQSKLGVSTTSIHGVSIILDVVIDDSIADCNVVFDTALLVSS